MSEKNEEKPTPAAAPAAAKRKIGGLGRGLNALIEGSYEKKSERVGLVPHPVNSVGLISVNQIEANPYQPRTHFDQQALQDLAESIKVQGIIQPVTLRQTGTNTYQLISGERRLQAPSWPVSTPFLLTSARPMTSKCWKWHSSRTFSVRTSMPLK